MSFEQIIDRICLSSDMTGCVINYYPHIIKQYTNGGKFKNENFNELKIFTKNLVEEITTEYIYKNKKMIVDANGNKEFQCIQQKTCFMNNGLYEVLNIEFIDPNKFPILNKYYDVSKKHVYKYLDKYVTVSLINETIDEKTTINYIKLSFSVPQNETQKQSLYRHLKAIIALI